MVRLLQLRDLVLDHLDPRRLLHHFGQAWSNGGPIAISWGWPFISAFILLIGFTMSELVSAYPTSGGIYWWAAKLGGPAARFFTGWLNLIGLVAVTASVAYGAANFVDIFISTISDTWAANYSLQRVFIEFVVILAARRARQHLLQPPPGRDQQRLGVVARRRRRADRADPHRGPRPPPDIGWVFSERINNSGLRRRCHQRRRCSGSSSAARLPADAVHDHRLRRLRAPVGGDRAASNGAARGIWQSIFYSAIGGWILLLALCSRSRTRRASPTGSTSATTAPT